MKAAKRLATVIDLDEARRKRARAFHRAYSAVKPESSDNGAASVPVTLMNGTVLRVDVSDLSLEGVKLRTTEADASTLYAPGQFIGKETPVIEIKIDLPVPEGQVRLLARCRLTHLEMLSPEDVTFTLAFHAFAGAGKAVLRHFLRIHADRQLAEKRSDGEVVALGKGRGF
jgi:hypothetical protein